MIRHHGFLHTFAFVLLGAIPYAAGYWTARHFGLYHWAWVFGFIALAIAHAITRPFTRRRGRRYNPRK